MDEDFRLVRSCQKGDIDAFETLVEKYQKKMLNIAYRMIGDYEEACEAVQDAFLSAYKAIRKFRGESRFSTWLYSIVVIARESHEGTVILTAMVKPEKIAELREKLNLTGKVQEKSTPSAIPEGDAWLRIEIISNR